MKDKSNLIYIGLQIITVILLLYGLTVQHKRIIVLESQNSLLQQIVDKQSKK